MDVPCQKCGEQVSDDQAFCPHCGAVIGAESMTEAGATSASWNLEATISGTGSRPRADAGGAVAPRESTPSGAGAAPAPDAPSAPPAHAAHAPRSSPAALFVGLAAIIFLGGLLIFLFYNFLAR